VVKNGFLKKNNNPLFLLYILCILEDSLGENYGIYAIILYIFIIFYTIE